VKVKMIAAAAVIGIAGTVAIALSATSTPRAGDPCARARTLVALVRANASAREVFDASASGAEATRAAAEADPHWVQLASGMAALDHALHADDAEAARAGIDVVTAACGGLS
jgi:hypothetical protein